MSLPAEWMPPLRQLPPLGLASIGTSDAERLINWANAHALRCIEAYKASLKPAAWASEMNGELCSLTHNEAVMHGWLRFGAKVINIYRLDEEPK